MNVAEQIVGSSLLVSTGLRIVGDSLNSSMLTAV